jgi:hypothetical protein
MSYPTSKSANENTTEGMAKGGHFLLTSGGTATKAFTRSVSSIDVKSGVVVVATATQTQKLNDPENNEDYPDWAAVTLEKGIHILDFARCSLTGATGVTQVNYGV